MLSKGPHKNQELTGLSINFNYFPERKDSLELNPAKCIVCQNKHQESSREKGKLTDNPNSKENSTSYGGTCV